MNDKPIIACVGIDANAQRVAHDLHVNPGHRRVIIVFDNHDIDRLRGHRGANVLWLDYRVTKAQYEFVLAQEFVEVTIEQAREALHGRS
jgi:hypothetical protein